MKLLIVTFLILGQFTFCVESAEDGITYEHMQTIIESVLIESGYYDVSVQNRNRTSSMGPVVANGDSFGIHQSLKSV